MKPSTVPILLRDLLALLHAAILAHPNEHAVAATLRALAADAQRLASKLDRRLT